MYVKPIRHTREEYAPSMNLQPYTISDLMRILTFLAYFHRASKT